MISQSELNDQYHLERLGPTDKIYHGIIADVLENGASKEDRTQTGTRAVFGRLARFNLMNNRIPRITTKLINENPEEEMLWFISGTPSIKALRDKGIGIWNNWLIPGTAQYRPMKPFEVERAITAALRKRDGDDITVKFIHSPVWDAGDFAENADFEDGKTIQVIWTDDASLTKYYTVLTGKEAVYLADGNIGAGAYGPQWRHWKDTQLVSKADLLDYRNQGYKQLGTVSPPDLPFGEEALKDALRERFESEGFGSINMGRAEFDMLPDAGYEIVVSGPGAPVKAVHLLYEGEEELIKAYTAVFDVPRFVMYREIDQLANAIELLKSNPDSRRIIVTAWNPALIWKAALPPCHLYFQFISHEMTLEQRVFIYKDRQDLAAHDEVGKTIYNEKVRSMFAGADIGDALKAGISREHQHLTLDALGIPRRSLNTFLLLRSNDLGLGFPFNVTQYAALTHMVAQVTGLAAGELVWAAVDAHIYENHIDVIKEMQLTRESKACIPRLMLNPDIKNIDDFNSGDLKVIDYQSHGSLAKYMPPAV